LSCWCWKLHLVCAVGAIWIPLAALLTPAAEADNTQAPALIREPPLELRFLLGDQHYRDPDLEDLCALRGCILVPPMGGPYPHTDAGVEVRRILHELRSRAIETFNGQFKAIFDADEPVPTRGLRATRRFALGAVLVYQLERSSAMEPLPHDPLAKESRRPPRLRLPRPSNRRTMRTCVCVTA
jgi:hypothetical protein